MTVKDKWTPNKLARLRATLIRVYPELRIVDIDYIVTLLERGLINIDQAVMEIKHYQKVGSDDPSLTCYSLFSYDQHLQRKATEDMLIDLNFQ